MSKISNPSAPIDAPAAPSAGSVTAPFARENLVALQHPALRPSAGGSAGGHVGNVARLIVDQAGGKLDRR
jgi:hypothetical protein